MPDGCILCDDGRGSIHRWAYFTYMSSLQCCAKVVSEMREFRSLSPRTLREISPENSSVFSQCLERYFFKTKDESSPLFGEENENSLPER